MKIKQILVIAILLLAGFQAAGQAKIKVACIGNSITAGSGISDPAKNSYPAILQQLLGEKYEVINYGISARTALSKGDRPYIKEGKFTESQEFMPDIVIIKLGTNDSKPHNWDSYSVEFEGDVREMVNTYKNLESRPKVYLCFPTWVGENRFKIRENIIAAEIIPTLVKVTEDTGCSTIDLHSTLYGMPHLLPDGVHPNAVGAVLIANTVYNRIK